MQEKHKKQVEYWLNELPNTEELFDFNKSKKKIKKINHEIKPIFIEIETYRYCPHVGPEENSEYRSQEELDYWIKNDCIEIAKKNMLR